MSLFPRLLGPLTVAVAFAASASPALADSSVTFPATTVEITDPGAASPTVHLTVTAADPADLENTHVFLGGDTLTPYHAIGVDGVRDARYAAADDYDVDGELSTETCAVYNGSQRRGPSPVTVAEDGASFSADLPKGEVISFESTGVAVGIEGTDTACANQGFDGLEVDYVNSHQTIDGFTWSAPAAPVVTHVTGGRRQVALSFDQEPGTQYDIYRVGEDTPFASNIRGDGDDVQVVLTRTPTASPLTPGTEYAFQVKATRLFNIWQGDDMIQPDEPAQRRGHRHDRRGAGRRVHRHAGGEHDRSQRALQLVDQRQRRGRVPVVRAGPDRDVRHRGPLHGDGRRDRRRLRRRAHAHRVPG